MPWKTWLVCQERWAAATGAVLADVAQRV